MFTKSRKCDFKLEPVLYLSALCQYHKITVCSVSLQFCLFCFVHHLKGKSHFKLHHTNVLFYSLSFCCFYFAMFTQKSASSCLIFIKITKVTLISISNLLSLNVLLSFDSLLLYTDFDFNNKDIFVYFV